MFIDSSYLFFIDFLLLDLTIPLVLCLSRSVFNHYIVFPLERI
jgi:hypothetical protein